MATLKSLPAVKAGIFHFQLDILAISAQRKISLVSSIFFLGCPESALDLGKSG
jgi:hypothetical protein